jgi:hypothetical protein
MDVRANEATRPVSAAATARLLWSACRPEPDAAGIAAAVDAGADLPLAANLALEQRVGPLLWRGLDRPEPGLDLDHRAPWAGALADDHARSRAQALLLQPQFAAVALAPLAAAGVEPLAVKGAALVARYPAPGLRPMDDVDLIVPVEREGRALDALRDAGWRVAHSPGREHHEHALVHPTLRGFPLELHSSLATWRDRANDLDAGTLWARRRPATVFGSPAFDLAPEDELVMLLSHAGNPHHLFRRLLWTVDVAVVVHTAAAAGRPVDWDRVARVADGCGARTVVAVGLAQAARLGVASPDELRRLPASPRRRRSLAPFLADDWPVASRDAGIDERRYALADRRWRQLGLVAGDLTRDGLGALPGHAADRATRYLRRLRRG